MKLANISIAFVIALSSLSLYSWTHADSPAPTAQPLHFLGHVQPQTHVAISATSSLPITALPFQEGQHVTKGDTQNGTTTPASILARLEDGDLKAALRAAEAKRDAQTAEIAAAQVRLSVLESQRASILVALGEAQRNWERLNKISSTTCVTQTETDSTHCKYDRLQAEYAAAERSYAAGQANLIVLQKNLHVAEIDIERARISLSGATLTAPIDGVITRLNVHVGEVVTGTINQPGTVLMEIADLDHLILVTKVPEDHIAQIRVGQKAQIHLKGFPSQTFTGTVQTIALTATEEKDGSRYFQTHITLDTHNRPIPAGLSGEAYLDTPLAHD